MLRVTWAREQRQGALGRGLLPDLCVRPQGAAGASFYPQAVSDAHQIRMGGGD